MRTASKVVAAFLVAAASGSCSAGPEEDVSTVALEVQSVGQQKLVAPSPYHNDMLGNAVAISGNTLIVGDALDDVGAKVDQGSAIVYVRSGAQWTVQQQLVVPNGTANARFGQSVAILGDIAVVGANGATNVAGSGNVGAAYVYRRSSGSWSLSQVLTPENGAANTGFGFSAAVDGDTLVLGGNSSAFVFTLANDTFGSRTKLAAPPQATTFGYAVATSTGVVLVGSPELSGGSGSGAVYAFDRAGSAFGLTATITSSEAAPASRFGQSVAISGTTALVGASQAIGGGAFRGVAFAFTRSGNSFAQQAKLQASDGVLDDRFGFSVALLGDMALVGSPFHEHQGINANHGSAYLFQRTGSSWVEQEELRATDAQNNDFFGTAVALSSENAIVGSPNDDVPFAAQGSAYVFALTGVPPGGGNCQPSVGSGFLEVSAGEHFTCGIKTDLRLVCWGRNDFGQASPPCGTFTHVATGFQAACAVRTGGEIVCWGGFFSGPPPAGPASTLSLKYQHACIARGDGPAVCWGSPNSYGESTSPAETFASVSTGGVHSCALRGDSSVACWGASANNSGQANPPPGPFHSLALGLVTTCALRQDNTIACWGADVGFGPPPPSGTFRVIDLGQFFGCGIRTTDSLACWGQFPSQPAPSGAFKSLSLGGSHACAIRLNDQLVCWGSNDSGELTPPP